MPGIVGYTINSPDDSRNPQIKKMTEKLKHKPWQESTIHSEPMLDIGLVDVCLSEDSSLVFNEGKTKGLLVYGKVLVDNENPGFSNHRHLLDLFEKNGVGLFSKLDGSWVIVLWDIEAKKTLIVSDRFGTRPLYYYSSNKQLLFASEVKGILEYPVPKLIDKESIAQFFGLGRLIDDKTFFEGIRVMPPASVMTFENGGLSIERYWDLNYLSDKSVSENEYSSQLVDAFKTAVRKRMSPNKRYSISLSGGLDSRSVLSEAIKVDHTLSSFTFGSKTCTDVRVANLVAKRMNLENTLVTYNSEELVEYIEELISLTEGMLPIHWGIWLPFVLNKIRDLSGNVTLLQGFAFDLLLGGSYLTEKILTVESKEQLKKLLYRRLVLFNEEELSRLFTKNYYDAIKGKPGKVLTKVLEESKGDSISNMSDYFFMRTHVRRLTMMGSVLISNFFDEVFPTLDNFLVEVITKIPPQLRYRHRIYKKFLGELNEPLTKIPYARTMARVDAPYTVWRVSAFVHNILAQFPSRILLRLSRGRICSIKKNTYFDLNYALLFSKNWQNLLKRTLLNSNAVIYKANVLSKKYVYSLINEHFYGKRDNSAKISYIITFELFLRMFFEHEPMFRTHESGT